MKDLIAFCKDKGFVFPGSELYGGLKAAYDFGPLGVELKNNIKKEWWRYFVQEHGGIGMDGGVMLCPKILEAVGYNKFSDDMFLVGNDSILRPGTSGSQLPNFLNFKRSMRLGLPFSICQIGRVFRNEKNARGFIFRMREFEQMTLQHLCTKDQAKPAYEFYKDFAWKFLTERLGLDSDKMRFAPHEKPNHYAVAGIDIEYNYSFGWGEITGIHNRSDYDLTLHEEKSGQSMKVDGAIPHVVDCCSGLERVMLAVLEQAYDGEIFNIKSSLAPYKVAVLPVKKKLSHKAKEICSMLRQHFVVTYDETESMQKRYVRQDEIGTPICVVVDFEDDKKVGLRLRGEDTQRRIAIAELVEVINDHCKA